MSDAKPLCPFHAGTLRRLRTRHPHMDRATRKTFADAFAKSCCTYWLKRGVPTGWWD